MEISTMQVIQNPESFLGVGMLSWSAPVSLRPNYPPASLGQCCTQTFEYSLLNQID